MRRIVRRSRWTTLISRWPGGRRWCAFTCSARYRTSARNQRKAMRERRLTLGEEIANSVTHGVALLASVAALPILVAVAVARRDPWQVAGGTIFGVTLITLYAASTLYHALPHSRAKRVFRVLDHSAIYLLIAGTYTPFALGALRGAWGWALLGTVWTLAVLGIIAKATFGFRFPRLSAAVYLMMGWLAVIAFGPLMAQ